MLNVEKCHLLAVWESTMAVGVSAQVLVIRTDRDIVVRREETGSRYFEQNGQKKSPPERG
ncbi:isocitrate/isopropylmalate dehydrogenase [Rhabdobacter roseus]|uniref:Isocitrate/isopropylmalate dehydrogenase n=1 Tax=Rhabdobacter roseus TaxID=1655419 RepID=A0A840TP41_9BACT|nr:isocitrate/isopropylmalate dehydrogenase [Rhabdobacter roseus]